MKGFGRILLIALISCLSVNVVAYAKTHTIQDGETFSSIAAKYGVTEAQLKSRNPKITECMKGLMLDIPDIKQVVYRKPSKTVNMALKGGPEYQKWLDNRYSSDKKTVKYAEECLVKAYRAGYPDAVAAYSKLLFYGGKGIKKDEVKALDVLYQAATEGDAASKYKMYDMYHYFSTGRKRPASFPREEILDIWREEAVDAGVPEAMDNEAMKCEKGYRPGGCDSVRAAMLYERILSENSIEDLSEYRYNKTVQNLTNLRSHLKGTPREAYRKGVSYEEKGKYGLSHIYYLKAAEGGDVKSMASVGKNYEEGHGVSKSLSEATSWYEKAGKKGDKKSASRAATLKKETEAAKRAVAEPSQMASAYTGTNANSTVQKSTTGTTVQSAPQKRSGSKFMDVLDKLGKGLDALNESLSAVNNGSGSGSRSSAGESNYDSSYTAYEEIEEEQPKAGRSPEEIARRNRATLECNITYNKMVQKKMEVHSLFRKSNNTYLSVKKDAPGSKACKDIFDKCMEMQKIIRKMEKEMRQYRKDCFEKYKISVRFSPIETETPKMRL